MRSPLNSYGINTDFWFSSVTNFTTIIFICNIKLWQLTNVYSWLNIFAYWGSFLIYFVLAWIVQTNHTFKSYNTHITIYASPPFYLIVLLISTISFLLTSFDNLLGSRLFINCAGYFKYLVLKKNSSFSEQEIEDLERLHKTYYKGVKNRERKLEMINWLKLLKRFKINF